MNCSNIVSLRLLAGNRNVVGMVNLASLALGMACALLLLLGAYNELSYDSFHRNRNQIYRLVMKGETANGQVDYKPSIDYLLADNLVASLFQKEQSGRADIANGATRINRNQLSGSPPTNFLPAPGSHYLTHIARLAPQQGFLQSGSVQGWDAFFHFSESSIFDIFDLPFVRGDSRTALARPASVVLTEDMAKKYYRGTDPVGQKLVFSTAEQSFVFTVTGVLKSVPHNSSLRINFLAYLPFTQLAERIAPTPLYTYTFLNFGGIQRPPFSFPGTILHDLFLWKSPVHVSAVVRSFERELVNISYRDREDDIVFKGYRLACEPLAALHFSTDHGFGAIAGVRPEPLRLTSRSLVFLIVFVAGNILAISCINVINITAANSAGRAREIAIRKMMGADRRRLIIRFLADSTVLSLVALLFSLSFVEILGAVFNISLPGYDSAPAHNYFCLGIIYCCLVLTTGFLSGIYPALFLSSLPPVQTITCDDLPSTKRIQKGLVVVQLSSAVSLFIFSLFFTIQGTGLSPQSIALDAGSPAAADRKAVTRPTSHLLTGTVGSGEYRVNLHGDPQAHWHRSISFAGFSAILLSAFGLASFAHYETKRKTKEIGIRKTLGATRAQLCFSFTSRFIPVILLAIAIAWVISLIALPRVFQMIDYPFMVPTTLPIMMYASSVTLLVTLSIVCLQIFRAASVRPVEALRNE